MGFWAGSRGKHTSRWLAMCGLVVAIAYGEAFDGVHARAAPAARATSVVKFKKTTLQSYSSS